MTLSHPPLHDGPRWYRTRIRSTGSVVGLLPPLAIGAIAWLALELFDGQWSGLIGLFGGAIAAPGLLVAGAPFADSDHYPLAILASVPLWLIVGFLASRRATRSPVATWREYWHEYVWIAGGVAKIFLFV